MEFVNNQDLMRRLESLTEKIDGVLKSPPSSLKKGSLPLPDGMQRAVRTVVKKLCSLEENPLVLDYSRFTSNDSERVALETRRLFADQKWGLGTIIEAFKKVWRNMRDEEGRRTRGKYNHHRSTSRKNRRIKLKLERRLKSVSKMGWSPRKTRIVEEALTLPLTSPEVPVGSSGEWERQPFGWESSKLAKVKMDLDECYIDLLTPRCRRQLIISKEAEEAVQGDPPKEAAKWTVSKSFK